MVAASISAVAMIGLQYYGVYVVGILGIPPQDYVPPSFVFYFVPFMLVTISSTACIFMIYFNQQNDVLWGLSSIILIILDYVIFRFMLTWVIVFLVMGLFPTVLKYGNKATNRN
jgi:hypothetical protein